MRSQAIERVHRALEDIANVRRIRAVITAGRFLDRSALDQLLTQAKTAAQQ